MKKNPYKGLDADDISLMYAPLEIMDSAISCGVYQVEGVNCIQAHKDDGIPVEASVCGLLDSVYVEQRAAFLLFSDLENEGGRMLANCIRKYKLGKVTRSSALRNPNTGNRIEVFIWEVDKKACAKWLKEQTKLITSAGLRSDIFSDCW